MVRIFEQLVILGFLILEKLDKKLPFQSAYWAHLEYQATKESPSMDHILVETKSSFHNRYTGV